ncbi:MAG: hypothetical protein WC381_02205 [Kiritimatiellia bacterium]|jgi:hypothetical protein
MTTKKPTVFSRWVSNNLTTGGMTLSASVGHREGAAFNQAQYERPEKSANNLYDDKTAVHAKYSMLPGFWCQYLILRPKSSPKTGGLFYDRAFRPVPARRQGPAALHIGRSLGCGFSALASLRLTNQAAHAQIGRQHTLALKSAEQEGSKA